MWGSVAKYGSRPVIELVLHPLNLSSAVDTKVCAFWKVLPEQSIGILVGATLPGALGVGKVDLNLGLTRKQLVLAHFAASVMGHGQLQLLWEIFELLGKGLAYIWRGLTLQWYQDD